MVVKSFIVQAHVGTHKQLMTVLPSILKLHKANQKIIPMSGHLFTNNVLVVILIWKLPRLTNYAHISALIKNYRTKLKAIQIGWLKSSELSLSLTELLIYLCCRNKIRIQKLIGFILSKTSFLINAFKKFLSSFANIPTGLPFAKWLTNVLRSLFGQRCLHVKIMRTFKVKFKARFVARLSYHPPHNIS